MNYYDLNKETALNAPDEPGLVSTFDNKANVENTKLGVPSIQQELFKMLEENPEGVRVGWEIRRN